MSCTFCYEKHNYSAQLCSGCYTSGRIVVEFVADRRHDHIKPSFPDNATTYEKVTRWIYFAADKIKQLEDRVQIGENTAEKKVEFLERLCSQFRKETPPDIQLKPGDDDQPCLLPAHVAMLAARSEVLKNVVSADDELNQLMKPSAANHKSTVLTISELNGEELKSLVEFLYTGGLSKEMMDKHAYSLLIVADKYDIPYLLQVCETHIVHSVASGDMNDQLADKCSKFLRDNQTLPAVLSSNSPPQFLEMLMKAYVSGATGH